MRGFPYSVSAKFYLGIEASGEVAAPVSGVAAGSGTVAGTASAMGDELLSDEVALLSLLELEVEHETLLLSVAEESLLEDDEALQQSVLEDV